MPQSTKKKPAKPFPSFPLFAHQNGQWAKKIRGRLNYFGLWDEPEEALKRFERQWPYLSKGETPPQEQSDGQPAGLLLDDLINRFLNFKQGRLESGELSRSSFQDYHTTCKKLIEHFGKQCRVDQLTPHDFEGLRRKLMRDYSAITAGNEITRIRIVFLYAYDSELLSQPVRVGKEFKKPKAKLIAKEKEKAGEKLFSRDEVLAILAEAETDPILKAMILLGLNVGFGNGDLASLPKSAIDWKTGWITHARPKTCVNRRVPLWPETVAALQFAIDRRPKARSSEYEKLAFLTVQGRPYVRETPSKTNPDAFVRVDTIASRFSKILKKLKINGRRRLGFYSLRHTFATIASGSKDQIAVNSIMGHSDNTMAANYRHGVADDRLVEVVNHVRSWLFQEGGQSNV